MLATTVSEAEIAELEANAYGWDADDAEDQNAEVISFLQLIARDEPLVVKIKDFLKAGVSREAPACHCGESHYSFDAGPTRPLPEWSAINPAKRRGPTGAGTVTRSAGSTPAAGWERPLEPPAPASCRARACYNCGKTGHLAASCPAQAQTLEAAVRRALAEHAAAAAAPPVPPATPAPWADPNAFTIARAMLEQAARSGAAAPSKETLRLNRARLLSASPGLDLTHFGAVELEPVKGREHELGPVPLWNVDAHKLKGAASVPLDRAAFLYPAPCETHCGCTVSEGLIEVRDEQWYATAFRCPARTRQTLSFLLAAFSQPLATESTYLGSRTLPTAFLQMLGHDPLSQDTLAHAWPTHYYEIMSLTHQASRVAAKWAGATLEPDAHKLTKLGDETASACVRPTVAGYFLHRVDYGAPGTAGAVERSSAASLTAPPLLSRPAHHAEPASDTTGAYTAKAVSATIKEAKACLPPRPPVKALAEGPASAGAAAPFLSRRLHDGEARDLARRGNMAAACEPDGAAATAAPTPPATEPRLSSLA
eukprot:tig00000227_g19863.t1